MLVNVYYRGSVHNLLVLYNTGSVINVFFSFLPNIQNTDARLLIRIMASDHLKAFVVFNHPALGSA